MSSLTIFSGNYTGSDVVISEAASKLGLSTVTDQELVKLAAEKFAFDEAKISKAIFKKASVFDKFTHEKARCVAFLKAAAAECLANDKKLFAGFCGQLIPHTITHALRICLVAEKKTRIENAVKRGISESEANRSISDHDQTCTNWTEYLFGKEPWDSSLYDLVLPTDKMSDQELVNVISEYLQRDILKNTKKSENAVRDFILQAAVEVALTDSGHEVGVAAEDGIVLLTIEKNVIMLSKLEDELRQIASKVPGVTDVKTRIGANFYQADIYRRTDFEAPSKILLVDDEQEFVQTLSERMLMRDLGTHVVYDGEQALSFIEDEEPEVMVLDLKMPGIDGMDVLRKIKADKPAIEVIILTGHGSAKDEEKCMELGAFAYLEKPVEIDLLTKTVNMAYAKIKKNNP